MKIGDTIKIGEYESIIHSSYGFYLQDKNNLNDRIFTQFGIDEKELHEFSTSKYKNYGVFPVCKTLDELQNMINYIKSKENKVMRQITAKQAQSIINIACPAWKKDLAEGWSKQIVLGEDVQIADTFYKQMRSACTPPQNELFDKIFGAEELKYSVGDYLYCIKDVVMGTGDTQFYQGKVYKSENNNNLTNNSGNKNHGAPGSWAIKHFRHATGQEIAKHLTPVLKEGTLCLVSDTKNDWFPRYADGEGGFYIDGEKSGSSNRWEYFIVFDEENINKVVETGR